MNIDLVGWPMFRAWAVVLGYFLIKSWLDPLISGDEGAMSSGTIAFLGIAYSILAGFLFVNVWQQWNLVNEACTPGALDKKKFDENKNKRIPETVKSLWLIFSVIMIASFFCLYFKNALPAMLTIFAVTFVINVYWEVVLDLDDPFTGVWKVTVPGEWKEPEEKEE